jgi:hypothetical protein
MTRGSLALHIMESGRDRDAETQRKTKINGTFRIQTDALLLLLERRSKSMLVFFVSDVFLCGSATLR